jgi:hypothetical protein
MTICIRLLATDGVVIATDSQESAPDLRACSQHVEVEY